MDPLLVVLGLAFLPPLLYLAGLCLRHPGRSAGAATLGFLYGATLSLLVLAALYALLFGAVGDPIRVLMQVIPERDIARDARRDFALIVVLAPFVEELAKGFGVWLLGGRLQTGRDGRFLGASVGLGFAATETFFYLAAGILEAAQGDPALAGVAIGVWVLAVTRAVTSALVHPAATGLTGMGIGHAKARGRSVLRALPWYLGAVLLHGAYNYLAGFFPDLDVGAGLVLPLGLFGAWLLASTAWGATKRGVAARW
ncbi:MAG: PrsW family intramembrane metalloprotease [Halobacteriales archaeon]|nr:PrsW family intramembrane metalloprotease [Halobacteriales archaeon]